MRQIHQEGRTKLEIIADFYLKIAKVKHLKVYEHSLRVGRLAEAAATALEIDPFLARMTGVLHDLGKIVLPFELFDERCITDDEFRQIKEHAKFAHDILGDDFPIIAAACGLHHSAGSGCKYGITHKDLPQYVRNDAAKLVVKLATLVSICDFVDAYTTRNSAQKWGGRDLESLLAEHYPHHKRAIEIVLAEKERTSYSRSSQIPVEILEQLPGAPPTPSA